MADEISVSAYVATDKNNVKVSSPQGRKKFDQTGLGSEVQEVTATTAAGGVAVTFGLSTPGWVRLRNEDETNFVEFGPYSGGIFYPLGKLQPASAAGEDDGGMALFQLASGVTLHLKADTASCVVEVLALED